MIKKNIGMNRISNLPDIRQDQILLLNLKETEEEKEARLASLPKLCANCDEENKVLLQGYIYYAKYYGRGGLAAGEKIN